MSPAPAEDIRRALVAGDAWRLDRLVALDNPATIRPRNDHEANIQLHLVRSIADSVPEPLRLVSRAWLDRNGYGFTLSA